MVCPGTIPFIFDLLFSQKRKNLNELPQPQRQK
jgi:hypothetical protein